MCGITGWFSPHELEPDSEERLRKMVKTIGHRGPDGEGGFRGRHAAFGHTRLAIIDLDTGWQPMSSSTGNTTIIFNGEIYNHLALRPLCTARGYEFKTRSDTEVILALYETGGIQEMARLRGMFAFALWDDTKAQGWLVRDPLGIKPLFYHADRHGRLVFSSEAKSIFASGFHRPQLEHASLHLLMNFRYLPGQYTLFEGVRQLPPNQALNWKTDGGFDLTIIDGETAHAGRETIDEIQDSVAAHMLADVEVGAYLSGGVDSATIVALARENTQAPLKTFTLDVGDDPMESRYAAKTAELLGVANTLGRPQGEVGASLRKMLWHLEVPKINSYQIFELAGLAAGDVKVCLSGLGGDELFLGYNAHGIMNKARWLNGVLPGFSSRTGGGLLSRVIRSVSSAPWSESERAALMLRSLGNWPRVYGLLRNLWDSPVLRARIYGPRMLDSRLPDAFGYLEQQWPHEADPVMAMAGYEKREKMVNDLLWQEDRLSMAHGLEVRVPFVDSMLFRHVSEIRRAQLMPGGKLKAYMKQTVTPLLPAEILRRPKSGFQVDAASFYRESLSGLAAEYLSAERLRDSGLFNPEFVGAIEKLPARKHYRWHFFMLYMMLMTHMWMDVFESR